MKKMILILLGLVTTIFAHPVSYNIDLVLSYDETTKMAKIECSSNSKNKCGLYSARLVDENWNEIYASVLVYDDQKNDCLKDNNLLKEKVVKYFSNGIQNLNNKEEFYDVYWKSVNDYEKKSANK